MRKRIKILFGLIILSVLINNVNAISKTINVNVIETRGLNLFFTPVNDIDDFTTIVGRNVGFMKDVYPLADDALSVSKGSKINAPDTLSSNKTIREEQIIDIKGDILTKAFFRRKKFINAIGIVRENYLDPLKPGFSVTGVNLNFGKAGVLLVEETQIKTTSHEAGHTLELCDEYDPGVWRDQNGTIEGGCPNGDLDGDGDLDLDCLLNPVGTGCPTQTFSKLFEDYGDINDTEPLRNFMGETDTPDFSTTPPSDFESWISNNSYNVLLSKLDIESNFSIPFIDTSLSYVILRLFFEKDGDFEIPNTYILEDGFITNSSKFEGNFSFEVLDENDNIISNISFEPNFVITTENGTDIEVNRTFVIFALPTNESLSKIRFRNKTSILEEVNKTPNTPNITITYPTGGELFDNPFNITWDATDLDNDTINYAVLISSDNGTTFSTLEIDYPNTTLTINSSNFINSHEYKIKILATDGINTGNDTTETFTISNPVPPIVTLVSPKNNNVSATGSITFNCSADDFNENLENITLYHNISGIWTANETKTITGAADYETFTINNIPNGNYIWNCLAYDNTSLSDWGDSNFTINVNVTILPDTSKFYIKDNLSQNVAWFGNLGNVVLKGTLTQNTTPTPTANDEFRFRDSNSNDVMLIDQTNGNMYIKGFLYENQNTLTPSIQSDDFIIRNASSDVVAYVNESGYLFLKGNLYENSNP